MDNRYVIISGEPGIGKTTLARVLVMHLLSRKFASESNFISYEEFYFTNSNIDDLVAVLQKGKRQVFFYDDFLGQISLEEGEKNFDSRIISFIKACQREKDKLFILTTREYILQQGLARYARFKESRDIEVAKCIIDMGKYTRFIRAQILYNHLAMSEIPKSFINEILKNKNYLKIIDHPHYSPRIIETFISNGIHEQCTQEEYFNKIVGYFDHPDSVWLDAFNRLSEIEQEALLVLNTMGTPSMYDDWKEAYYHFYEKVHKKSNYLSDRIWNEAIRILQNNFIKVGKNHTEMYVEFHNPGIKDVLTRYISSDEHLKKILLENSYYIEQLFGVFRKESKLRYKMFVPNSLKSLFFEQFDKIWNDYKSCNAHLYSFENKECCSRSPKSKAAVLLQLHNEFVEDLKSRPGYVEHKITRQIITDDTVELSTQLTLLKRINLSKTTLNMEELFTTFQQRLQGGDDCLFFATSVKDIFPTHIDYLKSDDFCAIVTNCLQQDLENFYESDLEDLCSTADELYKYIPTLEQKSIVNEIREQKDDYLESVNNQSEIYEEGFRYHQHNSFSANSEEIDHLFATLKEL